MGTLPSLTPATVPGQDVMEDNCRSDSDRSLLSTPGFAKALAARWTVEIAGVWRPVGWQKYRKGS